MHETSIVSSIVFTKSVQSFFAAKFYKSFLLTMLVRLPNFGEWNVFGCQTMSICKRPCKSFLPQNSDTASRLLTSDPDFSFRSQMQIPCDKDQLVVVVTALWTTIFNYTHAVVSIQHDFVAIATTSCYNKLLQHMNVDASDRRSQHHRHMLHRQKVPSGQEKSP